MDHSHWEAKQDVLVGQRPQRLDDSRRRVGGQAKRIAFSLISLALLSLVEGCSAVYPEMKTAVRQPRAGAAVEPAPAQDLFFITFEKAWIPPKTQGGQPWPGGTPDPFAKLIVDDIEIIQTPSQSKTREPTWPKQKRENYRIHPDSRVFVEVWASSAIANKPICRARVRDLAAIRDGGNNEIWCDSGARVWLKVEAAHALVGIGLYYETRGADGVRVTRVVADSPAARAGLSAGDKILGIQGRQVSKMDALEVRSTINLHARTDLELDVWFKTGKRHLIKLQEGAVYPLAGDDLELPQ